MLVIEVELIEKVKYAQERRHDVRFLHSIVLKVKKFITSERDNKSALFLCNNWITGDGIKHVDGKILFLTLK